MENEKSIRLVEPLYLTGIILILVSLIVFVITGHGEHSIGNQNYFGIFFINYAICGFYFALTLAKGYAGFKWPFFKTKTIYYIPMIILLIISAFSLNREITIFEKMADWVSIMLVILSIVLLAVPYIDNFPKFLRGCMVFCIAIILPLIIYFAIYLMPFYL